MNVFANPERLNLTSKQRQVWLPDLLVWLKEHPTVVGETLFGRRKSPWRKQDSLELERLLVSSVEEKTQLRNYLAILRSSAHFWSVATQQKVLLPHLLSRNENIDNPFSQSFVDAHLLYGRWKHQVTVWCETLFTTQNQVEDKRELLLCTFAVSAILHGGVLSTPYLVSLLRSIAQKQSTTFAIAGRLYVECTVQLPGTHNTERRLWIPDALSAQLWNQLRSEDVASLLAPQFSGKTLRDPADASVYQRFERRFRILQIRNRVDPATSLQKLRQSARLIQLMETSPIIVAYCNSQLTSNSPHRADVRRLFPGHSLYSSVSTATSLETFTHQEALHDSRDDAGNNLDTEVWRAAFIATLHKPSPQRDLARLAKDQNSSDAQKLFAGFALSLLTTTPLSGRPLSKRRVARLIGILSSGIWQAAEQCDLRACTPQERRTIYLTALSAQPKATQRILLQAIIELDAYLVAQNSSALPVSRSALPWPSRLSSVDINFVTHAEYERLLQAIDRHPVAAKSERRRKILRLLVILAFRCGLRKNELRRLRISDLLMRAFGHSGMEHLLELQVRPRTDDPLKTQNAARRIHLGALLSAEESTELHNWYVLRCEETASVQCHLFTLSVESNSQLSLSFFQDLNTLLRDNSRHANHGQGIHLHHLRHSSQSWLLLALLSQADKKTSRPIFPDLIDTNQWLAQSRMMHERILGSSTPTRKIPFLLARIAGHSSFCVSAVSYIHFFPWITAAALDSSVKMQPEAIAIQLASGLPPSTFRRRLETGGYHALAYHAYLQSPGHSHSGDFKTDVQIAPLEKSWLYDTWAKLMCASRGDVVDPCPIKDAAQLLRAKQLKEWKSGDNFRHEMECGANDWKYRDAKTRIACPRKPVHQRNHVPKYLQQMIEKIAQQDIRLLQDALQTFARRVEVNAFVRFDSPECASEAVRYVSFLRRLNLPKRKIKLIIRDNHVHSKWKAAWKDALEIPNLLIQPRLRSGFCGPNSALFVGPDFQYAKQSLGTGPTGFRFLMAMAYIVYGADPPNL